MGPRARGMTLSGARADRAGRVLRVGPETSSPYPLPHWGRGVLGCTPTESGSRMHSQELGVLGCTLRSERVT